MKAQEGHRASEHVYGNLVMAPFVGLAYVITLPFIAIGTMVVAIGKKAVNGLCHLAGSLTSFGWRPLESNLAGKKKERKRKGDKA
jgi:hypothetical protein